MCLWIESGNMRQLLVAALITGGLAGCAHMNVVEPVQSSVTHAGAQAPSPSSIFEKGLIAQRAGRYGSAVRLFLIAARQGNVGAQMRLSQIYRRDHKGVKRDLAASVHWLRQAALQGSPSAQDQLGNRYYLGLGVKRDPRRALQWYEKAANQGYSHAQFRLSEMYYLGRGTKKDLAKAAKWYREGALRGESYGGSFGRYLMGHMYRTGEGVKRNIGAAIRWLASAVNDQLPAATPPGDFGHNISITADGAAPSLAPLERRARNDARLELAAIYENGEGTPKDDSRAIRLIEQASNDGSVKAKIALARHYLDGIGVRRDLPMAIRLFSEVPDKTEYGIAAATAAAVDKAVSAGEKAYRRKHYRAALHNLEAAANHGNARAQYLLGNMYFGGAGLPKDYAQAIRRWKQAALQDNLNAITALGNAYWIGIDAHGRNGSEALKDLLYAAKKGDGKAKGTIATVVFPGWHYVTAFNGRIDLISRRRAQKDGDLTLFWVMSVAAPGSIQEGYKFSKYTELLYYADCKRRRLGLKNVIDYTPAGRVIKSYPHPANDMRFVVPNAISGAYLGYVCPGGNELTSGP